MDFFELNHIELLCQNIENKSDDFKLGFYEGIRVAKELLANSMQHNNSISPRKSSK